MQNSLKKEEIIICQGCESSCEVYVIIEDGVITNVAGNNCPTGAEFASSVCKRTMNLKLQFKKEQDSTNVE